MNPLTRLDSRPRSTLSSVHPFVLQLTMEGVCILLQEKPDWDTAKKVLGESNFIKRLMDFDKDNISEKVVRSIKRVIDDPAFTPDQVGCRLWVVGCTVTGVMDDSHRRRVGVMFSSRPACLSKVAKQSKAAMSMCLWVRAMDTYARVVKIVEPKRQVLRVAQVRGGVFTCDWGESCTFSLSVHFVSLVQSSPAFKMTHIPRPAVCPG